MKTLISPAMIRSSIENFYDAYEHKDIEKLMSMVAPDIICIGSAEGEKLIGAEELRKSIKEDFKGFDSFKLNINYFESRSQEYMAWAVVECSGEMTINNEILLLEARNTFIFAEYGDRLLITHSHFSFPTPNPY